MTLSPTWFIKLVWQNNYKQFSTYLGMAVNWNPRESPTENGVKNISAYGEKLFF